MDIEGENVVSYSGKNFPSSDGCEKKRRQKSTGANYYLERLVVFFYLLRSNPVHNYVPEVWGMAVILGHNYLMHTFAFLCTAWDISQKISTAFANLLEKFTPSII